MIFENFAAIFDDFEPIFDNFAAIFDDFVAIFDDSEYTTIIWRLYNDFLIDSSLEIHTYCANL